MDFEVSYDLEDENQFWAEIDDLVSTTGESHEAIDNTLRSFLAFATNFKAEYLQTEEDITRCTLKLLESTVVANNRDYVRRQILYGLLQEDDAPALHLMTAFLLYDGRSSDETFELMQEEGGFPRLIELVQDFGDGKDDALHRLLLDLVYEMSRIQRLTWGDLSSVDDAFVNYLFRIIESHSSDADDPYHYPVIRVLLVLNEQYMVANAAKHATSALLTNRVLKAISTHLMTYKTFGENLILLLNREVETSLQLLILKLLYLIFSNKQTADFFYTNDLYVLTDVILRNLLDLPAHEDQALQALQHTYLRVLHPLLANSQLPQEGTGYKRVEIKQVLAILGGDDARRGPHFEPVDDTTARLTRRCLDVDWLKDPTLPTNKPASTPNPEPEDDTGDEGGAGGGKGRDAGEGQKELARRMLGMNLERGGESTLSMAAVAEQHEKPGVITPSLAAGTAASGAAGP